MRALVRDLQEPADISQWQARVVQAASSEAGQDGRLVLAAGSLLPHFLGKSQRPSGPRTQSAAHPDPAMAGVQLRALGTLSLHGIHGTPKCCNSVEFSIIIRAPSPAAFLLVGLADTLVVVLLGRPRLKLLVRTANALHPPGLT